MACNSCIPYVVGIYVLYLAVIVCVWCIVDMSSRFGAEREMSSASSTGGGVSWLNDVMTGALDSFWFPVGETLIALVFGFYRRLTWFNMIVFILKYVPTGLFTYKTLKNVYITARERIKKKQIEVEDIHLQIQIIDTKLCVRDAEFSERTEQLRRNAKRLRLLRARVRDIIAADDALRKALHHAAEVGPTGDAVDDGDASNLLNNEDDCDFIMTLLKELKSGEHLPKSEMDKFEPAAEEKEPSIPDNSDAESKKECRVKIIKVTNVYKVACLKHYIKQKRIRRATQQAILKKKIESIKKLLESWHKSLNTVIYNKTAFDSAAVDLASQEAMGDYSKPNLREFSDSDSELKTSCTDMYCDEYNFNWSQNSYYNVENNESAIQEDMFDTSEYRHKQDLSYPQPQNMVHSPMCECSAGSGSVLFILPEETSSQVAIEEIESNRDVP